MIKKLYLMVFDLIAKFSIAFAPNPITGKVVDDKGNPIENVTVTVIKSNNLTQSKEGGIFCLTLGGNFQTATLMFSKLGIKLYLYGNFVRPCP